MRFDITKDQHDTVDAEQKAKFAAQAQAEKASIGNIEDPKQKMVEAKAELVRSTMAGKPLSTEVLQTLGDKTTPATGGKNYILKH